MISDVSICCSAILLRLRAYLQVIVNEITLNAYASAPAAPHNPTPLPSAQPTLQPSAPTLQPAPQLTVTTLRPTESPRPSRAPSLAPTAADAVTVAISLTLLADAAPSDAQV